MKNFVKRMIEEHKALNAKCLAAMDFLNGRKYEEGDVNFYAKETALLQCQLEYMTSYLNTLSDRLGLYDIKVVLNKDKRTFSYYEDVTE